MMVWKKVQARMKREPRAAKGSKDKEPKGGKGSKGSKDKVAGEGKGKEALLAAARASYHYDHVYHWREGHLLGIIRIWLGENSLTVKCETCKCRKNKRYTPHAGKNPELHAQGLCMGSMLEWLHLPCTGDRLSHAAKWTQEHLKYENRLAKRRHYFDLGALELQFGAERDPWPSEPDGEPKDVP